MKGNSEVIETLAAALPLEAHLNLQYRRDWRNLKFRGLKKLARKVRGLGSDAHDWMKQVDDRLLFLGGDDAYEIPAITDQPTVTAMFENELALEMAKLAPYEANIQICMKAFDDGSRNLFEHLVKWTQKHVAWLETQLSLIKYLGESEYLAEKL